MNGRPADLPGQRILITGAARGIGEAAARALAEAGARLALLDREQPRLEAVAAEIGAEAVACDVGDEAATRVGLDAAAERLGGLNAVVANAGIHVPGTVSEIDPADFRRVVEVNLLGTWHTFRAGLPHLVASGGYLLSVASLAAVLHLPTLGAYSASKAGVHALSNVLRLELTGSGVTVGCAYFGVVETRLVQEARAAAPAHASLARGPFRPLQPETAGKAIATAVTRRSRRLVRPRTLYPLVAIPSLFQLLVEHRTRASVELPARAPRDDRRPASG